MQKKFTKLRSISSIKKEITDKKNQRTIVIYHNHLKIIYHIDSSEVNYIRTTPGRIIFNNVVKNSLLELKVTNELKIY